MTSAASGTLDTGANFQCFLTLIHGEALHQFYSLSNDVENTEILNMDYIIRVLAQYFLPVNSLSKKKRAMRRGIKNRAD